MESDLLFRILNAHWATWGFAIALVVLLRFAKQAYVTPLRSIPGPRLAAFSRLWMLVKVWEGTGDHLYRDLHEKYGPVVRIAPNRVLLSDPAALNKVFSVGGIYVKSDFYKGFILNVIAEPLPGMPNPNRYNLFTTFDPHYHKRIKAAVGPAYSIASLKGLEPLVDACSATLVKQLRERSGTVVDLGEWLHFFAFDAISMITFSKDFGFLSKGKDTLHMLEGLFNNSIYCSVVGQMPWLHNVFLGNSTFQSLLERFTTLADYNPALAVRKLIYQSLQEYDPKTVDTRGDYVGHLRRMQAQGGRISDREVVDSLFINCFAGSDSTAISLKAVFYYLLKNRKAYAKLQEEIDAAEAAGKLSECVEYAQGNDLPYLKAVVKEALRMFPSVPLPYERVVPPGGAEFAGQYLPAGTGVGIAASVVNFDRGVFGSDSSEFRPERWLEADGQQLKEMERCFLTFGAGTRACIGRNIAMFEMLKVVPQVVRHFDLEWASEKKDWAIAGYIFARQEGVLARIKSRHAD